MRKSYPATAYIKPAFLLEGATLRPKPTNKPSGYIFFTKSYVGEKTEGKAH